MANLIGMTYIVQRKDRFYVVAYDGLDPITRKEHRRWHPVGHERHEAEALAARLDADHVNAAPARGGPVRYGEFLTSTWLPLKRRHLRATTAVRYSWYVDHYIQPALGDIPLRRLRPDHLDAVYDHLATTGGRSGGGLAPKTITDVHVVVRSSLDLAVRQQLLETNVALTADARHRRATTKVARAWTAQELAGFLAVARSHRLYPALHLTAFTGMRRGEVAGLKWSDLDRSNDRLSIARTIQNVAGRPVEFAVKTRTSRRCIDLDTKTMNVLGNWRRQLSRDGPPPRTRRLDVPEHRRPVHQPRVPQPALRPNPEADAVHPAHPLPRPASYPRVAPRDNRCSIKVVSERLGHAHPAFTMHTYQHLLPGMSAAAATEFAALIDAACR